MLLIADIAPQAATCGTVSNTIMVCVKRMTDIDDPALPKYTRYIARIEEFLRMPSLFFINLLSPVKANIKPLSFLFWIFDHEIFS